MMTIAEFRHSTHRGLQMFELPHVMPGIEVLLEAMGAASIFTKLDLKKGCYQVAVNPDQDKTTFVTQWVKFKFLVTPFGFRNAPSTFQRLMDSVLSDILVFSRSDIDNISIFSKSWSEHIQHLRAIFDHLHGANLTLQMPNCKVRTHSCEFLVHTVGVGSISPQQAKIDVMASIHRPITKKDVRNFLGLAGYYCHYIPNFSAITAPFSDLTSKQDPERVVWKEECQYDFDLKLALTTDPTLAPPDYDCYKQTCQTMASVPFFLKTMMVKNVQ